MAGQKWDAGGSPYNQVVLFANANENANPSSGDLTLFTYVAGFTSVKQAAKIDGNWHVFFGGRGSGSVFVQRDLEAESTASGTRDISDGNRKTLIGHGGKTGGNDAYDGMQSVVMMFDRYLDTSEREQLYYALTSDLAQVLEPANQTPFLVSVPAGGGAVTGTGALDLQTSQVDGSGVIGRIGSGALSAQTSEVAGTGTVGGVVTGTGTLADQDSAISGAGVVGRVGTGALSSQASFVDGVGSVVTAGSVTGTGTIDAQDSSVAGTGIIGRVGTGDLASQTSEVSGAGVLGRVGTGAVQCGTATINGIGIVSGNITGTGGLAFSVECGFR